MMFINNISASFISMSSLNFDSSNREYVLFIEIKKGKKDLLIRAMYKGSTKTYRLSNSLKLISKLEQVNDLLDNPLNNTKKNENILNELLNEIGTYLYNPINSFIDSASEINFIVNKETIKYPFDILSYNKTNLFLQKSIIYSFDRMNERYFLSISKDWMGLIVSDETTDPQRACLSVKEIFPCSKYYDIKELTIKDIIDIENPHFILISAHGNINSDSIDYISLKSDKILPENFTNKSPAIVYFDSCNLGVSFEFIDIFRSCRTSYYIAPILSNEAGNSSTKTIKYFFDNLLKNHSPSKSLFITRRSLYDVFKLQNDLITLLWRAAPFRIYQLN